MLQKLQIIQDEQSPFKVKVLVDGVDIANKIYSYKITQEPCGCPVMEVKSNLIGFEFDGTADVIDITAREEIKQLKEQHKKDMENNKILCGALEEYQRKYGE